MAALKDSIDFGKENIPALFRKMVIPTLLGMVSGILFILTDGVFVGRGIGAHALACINIVAPLFLLCTGIGLMFGMGASVTASIHLAAGKQKTARIHITQAVLGCASLMLLFSIVMLCLPTPILKLLGCSDLLMQAAKEYALVFIPSMAFQSLLCACGFYVRLSGAPKYAMVCSMVASCVNLVLDYLFIFPCRRGLIGAALATDIGAVTGVVMMLAYLMRDNVNLHLIRFKTTRKSMRLTFRNLHYICKLGIPSFLMEVSVAVLMLCGNYAFMRLAGENGVAAFSIACYLFPVVFMVYNAIAQSAQPIISYNHARSRLPVSPETPAPLPRKQPDARARVRQTYRISQLTAVSTGLLITAVFLIFPKAIISCFLHTDAPPSAIAISGLPLFALGFIPFALNITEIAYLQSIECSRAATWLTFLRGVVFTFIGFFILPRLIGLPGAWLALPAAEMLTLGCGAITASCFKPVSFS